MVRSCWGVPNFLEKLVTMNVAPSKKNCGGTHETGVAFLHLYYGLY